MTDLIAAARYPIHPALREGESLGGWCWRTYSANGYDMPATARSALLAIRTTRVLAADSALSQLMGFEGLKPLHDREFNIVEPWSKQRAPGWYVWSKRPRFCALCIAESECHLLYWDLPLVSACAVHGCQLTTKCYACRSMWSWPTLKRGWQCMCGTKIAEGQALEAPLSAVRLSRVLCAASDAVVPQTVKVTSSTSAPFSAPYQTRNVYEVLGWLLKLRRVMTDATHNSVSKFWPVVQRGRSRMVPGSWEISLMMGFPHTINRKARQTLRWFFRDSLSTVVDLHSVDRWHSVEKLMGELSATLNPLAGPIFSAIERAQVEHRTGIPGQETLLFNPQLSQAQRDKRLTELTTWLRLLSGSWPVMGPEVRPAPHQILGAHFSALSSHHTEAVIALLNVLFDAAHQEIPPTDFKQKSGAGDEGAEHAS